MTPKLSQNQTSEWNETKEIKVVALYELTPKQFEPDPNPQISLFLQQKLTLNQIKLKARIERDIENICCSAT